MILATIRIIFQGAFVAPFFVFSYIAQKEVVYNSVSLHLYLYREKSSALAKTGLYTFSKI